MTRREAISSLLPAAALAAAPPAPTFDPSFGSALDAAAAIRARKISSSELTKHVFARIDKYQPKLNAYVYQMREEATAAARKADEALAGKKVTGPLHGVPINVKESFGVAGRPCTWGNPAFKNARAERNSVAVRRLLDAGAILLGATNVPLNLTDAQSYNDIYGTTNNPWDVTRTPGGSSGGAAAALAAGLAFLSVGSDIGGSIRGPAHFCGIYGHKPTLDVVSLRGHEPGGSWSPPGFSTLLAAAGPLARSAEDLAAAMSILGGPEPPDSKAYSWKLPPARHAALKDYRIGYVLDDPLIPVSSELKPAFERMLRALEKAGATLKPGWPAGIGLKAMFDTYLFLLGAFDFSTSPPDVQAELRAQFSTTKEFPIAQGALADFAAWQRKNWERLGCRSAWQQYFGLIDVFLSPVMFTTAFPHDHSPRDARTFATPEGKHPFFDLLGYVCPANLTGCPATAAPIGKTAQGLPVGIQIMGPYLEDATPIRFAALLAREIGGFTPPPGY